EAPGPQAGATVLVAGLIDVDTLLLRQQLQQVGVSLFQTGADLGAQARQLATADRHAEDITNELANGGEGAMAGPFKVGDDAGQARTDQARLPDRLVDGRVVGLATVAAPERLAAMLVDCQGSLDQ